ncbi:GspH/FimT family pseudopilin [Allochromatium tepidum]|uniref:Type II secretion system protein H n=1 Tax=Allochromatium tepidum TaxID=553982 RepID=A0ABM7QPT9_9GAMM|nr:GspH/FimT family pseudopilin [Allochromatium tepidum]BCU07709.1 hypothetical protein Atep_23860 [Allochromatium tepidum]
MSYLPFFTLAQLAAPVWRRPMPACKPGKQRGLTLIELMVTLAVAVIILSMGIPSFQSMIQSNRLTSAANEFMAALNYARSEAIKRGQGIILCKTTTFTACTEGGNKWETGWMAFLDKDKNNKWSSGDEILRVWQALPAGYTLRPNNNFNNYLRYGPDGAANNLGTFALCYNNQTQGAKAIVITRLRPRLGKDSNGNQIPENDAGDISSCFISP